MFSTLLVIGGVVIGLLVLLALIVALSSRPQTRGVPTASRAPRVPGWVLDAGRAHPDAWAPLSNTSTEIRAIR